MPPEESIKGTTGKVTANVAWDFCLDQFSLGEPEFVFTTEGSQRNRRRRVFGIGERRRGSLIWHSVCSSNFLDCHFAMPMDKRFLDSIPRKLLHPEFTAVVIPVTPFEKCPAEFEYDAFSNNCPAWWCRRWPSPPSVPGSPQTWGTRVLLCQFHLVP